MTDSVFDRSLVGRELDELLPLHPYPPKNTQDPQELGASGSALVSLTSQLSHDPVCLLESFRKLIKRECWSCLIQVP